MPNLIRPVDNRVSQVFGARPSYYSQFGLLGHEGIDYASPVGTSMKAAADGVVHFVGSHKNYGTYIKIAHADGTKTAYAHLSAVSVKNGQQVSQGQLIGRTGDTGNVQGAHLHFMLLTSNTRNGYGGAINPEPYFNNPKKEETMTPYALNLLAQLGWNRAVNSDDKFVKNYQGKDVERTLADVLKSSENLELRTKAANYDKLKKAYDELAKKSAEAPKGYVEIKEKLYRKG